jgi:transmembrane sensor
VATHLLSDDAQLETVVDTEDRAELRLSEGEARFEVDPDHHREVLVHAGFVTVEVTGTVFDVAHLPGERVRVGVERGRVRVDWPGGTTSLEVGTARVFERPSPADEPPAASGSVSNEDQSPRGWRALAHEGDHERAFELLEQAGASAVRDEPADLLLAADVARLSGHPARAIEPLSRLVREYPSDARAPSAAFTLGLLQLGGNPAAAAQSFATCRRLQPAGPLAQDALARQVEATSRAGNPSAARALAEQYVQAYPNGRRVNAVKRFGGL